MADSGVTRVDLHVKILDSEVVKRAKQAGLDVLVYAPHFTQLSTTRERANQYSDEDLLVVPAREYFTGPWDNRKHVLGIDPAEPIPDFISLEATMAELNRQDTAVLAPHPEFLTMSLSGADISEYSDSIDAVEVYCPKNWPHHIRRAKAIASDTGLPAYASSYAHRHRTIGDVWVEFDRRIETATELTDAIKSGTDRTLRRKDGTGHTLTRTVECLDLVRENTVAKCKRVVLEDTEPTNPSQAAYDGRFQSETSH